MDNEIFMCSNGQCYPLFNWDEIDNIQFRQFEKREHPFDSEQAKIKIGLAACFRENFRQCNTKNLFFKIR